MLKQRARQLHLAFMAFDALAAAGVFVWLALQPSMLQPGAATRTGAASIVVLTGLVAVAWPLVLGRFQIYQSQRRESLGQVLARLLAANGLAALLLSTLAFTLEAPVAPVFPLLLSSLVFAIQASVRVPVYGLLHAARRTGRNTRNVVVIGAGPRAARALETIETRPEWGLRVIGFVDDGSGDFEPRVPHELIHKMIELPEVLREEAVDEVLVACPRSMLDSLVPVVRQCAEIGVPVTLLTDLFGDELPPPRVGRFDALGTISFAPVHHNELELAIKRGIDIVGALAGLLLTAPIVAASAIAIRAGSPGPVFFRQLRCGLHGRRFEMIKLRTMVADAERRKVELLHLNEMDGPVFKIREDPRVTPVGRFLRKWSIDELPQFWNVLRGDMSLVGPRPPTPDEVQHYQGSERRRLSMRPGLTCLWQINGRNELSFKEWMRLDLEYIDNWTLGADLKILLHTIPQILSGRGAS